MEHPRKRTPGRRRMAWLASLVAAATLSVGVIGAPVAGAAIYGSVSDLQVNADGSARLAVVPFFYRAPKGVQEYRLDPAGNAASSRPLVPKDRRHEWADAAFTSGGAVAAYRVSGKRRSVIRAVVWNAAGLAGPAQTLSNPAHGAGGVTVRAGASGLAVLVFKQGRGRAAWQDMIAVRPAGAERFRTAVPLGKVRRGDGFASDQPDRLSFAFAPDGSGAISQVREYPAGPLLLRRIAVDGTVSAAVTAAPGPYEFAASDVAIAADGTIVAALRAVEPQGDAFSLLATTLPPGATAATPLQRLGDSGASDADAPDLSLLLQPGGAPLLASRLGNGGNVQLFEGAPGSLAPTVAIPAPSRGAVRLVSSGDGGVSAVWSGASDPTERRDAIMGAHLPPGGAWSAARPLTKPRSYDPTLPSIGAVATAPGAGIMIAVEQPSGTRRGPRIELVRAP